MEKDEETYICSVWPPLLSVVIKQATLKEPFIIYEWSIASLVDILFCVHIVN